MPLCEEVYLKIGHQREVPVQMIPFKDSPLKWHKTTHSLICSCWCCRLSHSDTINIWPYCIHLWTWWITPRSYPHNIVVQEYFRMHRWNYFCLCSAWPKHARLCLAPWPAAR